MADDDYLPSPDSLMRARSYFPITGKKYQLSPKDATLSPTPYQFSQPQASEPDYVPTTEETTKNQVEHIANILRRGKDPRKLDEISPEERGQFSPNLTGGIPGGEQTYGIRPIDQSPDPNDPFERAAARTRKQAGHYAYMTPEERQEHQKGVLSAGNMGAYFANPLLGMGLSAGIPLAEGKYGEAASQAALSAVPYGVGKAIKAAPKLTTAALGGIGSTWADAMAEDTKFPWETDKDTRNALDAQHKNIRVRDDRGKFDPSLTEAARQKFVNDQRGAWQQRQEMSKSLEGFENLNKSTVQGLTPEQQKEYQSINVAGSPQETINQKSSYLKNRMAEANEAKKGLFDKYPWAATGTQIGSALASALIPYKGITNKAGAIRGATDEAEASYLASLKGRAAKSTKDVRDLRANQLAGQQGISPWEVGKLAMAPAIPYVAGTTVPSIIDMARLQSHPDWPAYQHAKEIANPFSDKGKDALIRSLEEGLGGESVGIVGGLARSHFPQAYSRGSSTLQSIRDKQSEEIAQALKRTASRKPKAASIAAPLPVPPPPTPSLGAPPTTQALPVPQAPVLSPQQKAAITRAKNKAAAAKQIP